MDPYDIFSIASVEGINTRKSRAHEDGYRVRVGHHLLTSQAGTIIMGSSRVADGYPREIPEWPGGWENMGMAGTSAYELAQASTLAAQNDNINCVIIGMDLREFGTEPNAHATYWITPMAGGGRFAALVKMALSPSAFARALQTYVDNTTGSSDTKWENAYAEDGLRRRFEEEIPKRYRSYSTYEYDPDRMRYLFRGIDSLLAADKQVRIIIHPLHVWQEEAIQRAGAGQYEIDLRRDLVEQLNQRNISSNSSNTCFDGPALQAWDFAGFSDVSTTAPPTYDGLTPNPWYFVPAHYRPTLGSAVLDRMLGLAAEYPIGDNFGRPIDASSLESILTDFQLRRNAWLSSDEEWEVYVSQAFDDLDANPPPPEAAPRVYLNETDWRNLEGKVRRVERSNQ
jgi:hypothetical protein